jgi:hypothetical protein
MKRRIRYQPTPVTVPPIASTRIRREPAARRTPSEKLPWLYPKAQCCTACSTTIIAMPARPAAIPVRPTSSQNLAESTASSPVAFGCSVAPPAGPHPVRQQRPRLAAADAVGIGRRHLTPPVPSALPPTILAVRADEQ